MAEMEAGKANSEVDMGWINGETFFQLRQIDALHGPFVDQLPIVADQLGQSFYQHRFSAACRRL
ncbi:MAG: hypothetical protein R2784_16740 [Saprospiraceae bacterium]